MNPNITIVTSFFDIGRSDWEGPGLPHYLKRTTNEYFLYFERFLKLENDIVVFTSNDLLHKFDHYHLVKKNLYVVGFEDWRKDLHPDIRKKVETIQNDPNYQELIEQPWNPEYWNTDYVMVNLLKSYFVNYAIECGFCKNDMVSWIDFGYARKPDCIPTNVWCYNFDPEKIHLFSIKDPENFGEYFGQNLKKIIMTNDVYVTGCHIVASKENWKYLLERMFLNMETLLLQNLCDDDQTLLMMGYIQDRNKYQIHFISPFDWFCVFRRFNNAIPVNTGEFNGVD